MRQLVYTKYIRNNHSSFHLWSKENLVKSQKVSKYYDHDCLQNFLLISTPLLIGPIVKKSNTFWLEFSLTIYQNVLNQT